MNNRIGRTAKRRAGKMPRDAHASSFQASSFDVLGFLLRTGPPGALTAYRAKQILYAQGDAADSIFYIHNGKVKDTVVSPRGSEAVVAIRGPNEFCGEQAIVGAPLRLSSAVTLTACNVIRLDRETMARLLRLDPEFADYFLCHLLTRTARVEADLFAQLFSSSEMRLARILLLLANYGGEFGPEPIPIKLNHELLAKMVVTTRPQVTVFLNKFRKLGLIDYNGELKVHKALLNYVLNSEGVFR